MSRDIVLFGASERHNFGDLLMGFAFERLLLDKGFNIIHASILENDLTTFSGRRVYSIYSLYHQGLDLSTPILHVGGETVPCGFEGALAYNLPLSLPVQQRGEIITEAHRLLDTDRKFPYVTPPIERISGEMARWKNRLFYGIGFTCPTEYDLETQNSLKEAFSESEMVGFRDALSLGNAKRLGIKNAMFTPDIVSYISKLVPRQKENGETYLLIHFSSDYLKAHREQLIAQLALIPKAVFGRMMIGIAGLANAHDSLDEIHQFKAQAESQSVFLEVLPSSTALDITKQIAHADMVISTSLHYRIVARSYGVPRISMNIHKVNSWAESNDASFPFGAETENLASMVESLTRNPRISDGDREDDDMKTIESHIERIHNLACSSTNGPGSSCHDLKMLPPPSPSPELWISSMSRCLETRDARIKRQKASIKQLEICLSSRQFLVKRLLTLLVPHQLLKLFKVGSR